MLAELALPARPARRECARQIVEQAQETVMEQQPAQLVVPAVGLRVPVKRAAVAVAAVQVIIMMTLCRRVLRHAQHQVPPVAKLPARALSLRLTAPMRWRLVQ